MSHLVCPLCGKNAPLSTLDPVGLDLDIRVVSFKGLGRGRGFEKAEEHSILGDEEYSPALANRSLQLCRMFIEAGVLERDVVEKMLDISSIKNTDRNMPHMMEIPNLQMLSDIKYPTSVEIFYLKQINELRNQLKVSDYEIISLQNKIREKYEEDNIK